MTRIERRADSPIIEYKRRVAVFAQPIREREIKRLPNSCRRTDEHGGTITVGRREIGSLELETVTGGESYADARCRTLDHCFDFDTDDARGNVSIGQLDIRFCLIMPIINK
ncbi:hypothetical protein [Burkholderia contaminans]|uniref:hypothetical protein n=1 Tax=Burkholderia contaminans TaxID=488447 RepID=UPI003D672371